MARAGLAYPERFYAAASYVGFNGSLDSSSRGVSSKFSNKVALLLYALYRQAILRPCKIAKHRGWSPVEQSKWTRLLKVDWAHQWIWPNGICRHVFLGHLHLKTVEFRTPSAMGREILKEETPSIAGNFLSSSKLVFSYLS